MKNIFTKITVLIVLLKISSFVLGMEDLPKTEIKVIASHLKTISKKFEKMNVLFIWLPKYGVEKPYVGGSENASQTFFNSCLRPLCRKILPEGVENITFTILTNQIVKKQEKTRFKKTREDAPNIFEVMDINAEGILGSTKQRMGDNAFQALQTLIKSKANPGLISDVLRIFYPNPSENECCIYFDIDTFSNPKMSNEMLCQLSKQKKGQVYLPKYPSCDLCGNDMFAFYGVSQNSMSPLYTNISENFIKKAGLFLKHTEIYEQNNFQGLKGVTNQLAVKIVENQWPELFSENILWTAGPRYLEKLQFNMFNMNTIEITQKPITTISWNDGRKSINTFTLYLRYLANNNKEGETWPAQYLNEEIHTYHNGRLVDWLNYILQDTDNKDELIFKIVSLSLMYEAIPSIQDSKSLLNDANNFEKNVMQEVSIALKTAKTDRYPSVPIKRGNDISLKTLESENIQNIYEKALESYFKDIRLNHLKQ
ncbi:MAG: hypothetical protein ACTSXG_00115 [Alphaproteobacteria bacterium]